VKENFGVTLTIDAYIPDLCESELEKCIQKYRAASGEVVVMDPNTFEILAMPIGLPSIRISMGKGTPTPGGTDPFTDFFEPGSTFKVFLVGAALEEGRIREKDRVFCENGKCVLAGHMIKDVHPYGWLTIPEVIKHSSNIAAGKLALQLGREQYYRYIKGSDSAPAPGSSSLGKPGVWCATGKSGVLSILPPRASARVLE